MFAEGMLVVESAKPMVYQPVKETSPWVKISKKLNTAIAKTMSGKYEEL